MSLVALSSSIVCSGERLVSIHFSSGVVYRPIATNGVAGWRYISADRPVGKATILGYLGSRRRWAALCQASPDLRVRSIMCMLNFLSKRTERFSWEEAIQ